MGVEEINNKNLSIENYPVKQLESPESLSQVQGRSTIILQSSHTVNIPGNTSENLRQIAKDINILSNHIIENSIEKGDIKDVEYSSIAHIKVEYSQTFVINNVQVSMKLVSEININNLKNRNSTRLFTERGDTYYPIEEKEAKIFDPTKSKYLILDTNPDGTISAYADKKTSQALSKRVAKIIDKDNNSIAINDLNVVPDELLEQFHGVVKLAINNYLLKLEKEDKKERDSEEEKAESKHSHAPYNPNYVSPLKANERLETTEADQEKEHKLFNRSQEQLLSQILEAESVLESIHDRKAVEKKQLQKEILQQEQASEELHKTEANKVLTRNPPEAA